MEYDKRDETVLHPWSIAIIDKENTEQVVDVTIVYATDQHENYITTFVMKTLMVNSTIDDTTDKTMIVNAWRTHTYIVIQSVPRFIPNSDIN